MYKYPKVLVVSHNVFSESGNMGRTMADMLSALPADHLAQLYFHSEIPTMKVCTRYFRVTDKDVLRSVFTRKPQYRIYEEKDIREDVATSRTDTGMTAKVYQYSRRRTPLIYTIRNLMWRVGRWNSKALEQWITDFQPDVLFFASGDYVFSYRVVYEIAKKYHLPVVMWCCDDHYIGKKDTVSDSYKKVQKNLVAWAKKVADISKGIVVISDKMKTDYSVLFGKEVEVIRISAKENAHRLEPAERSGIVYAGNLGVNRLDPLLELGRALKLAQISGYEYIDVYSGERDPQRLAMLSEENGIRFHGALPQQELSKVLGSAKYLLHVEAFDEMSMSRTRYSLSTKIGESLQSGACILAYGPKDISSMEYLSEHQAAVMVDSPQELPQIILKHQCSDESIYQDIVDKGMALAEKCHNKKLNDEIMLKVLG